MRRLTNIILYGMATIGIIGTFYITANKLYPYSPTAVKTGNYRIQKVYPILFPSGTQYVEIMPVSIENMTEKNYVIPLEPMLITLISLPIIIIRDRRYLIAFLLITYLGIIFYIAYPKSQFSYILISGSTYEKGG